MEEAGRVMMVMWLVIGIMLAGKCRGGSSSSSFMGCYEGCFLVCLITPSQAACSCPVKCLKDCILLPPAPSTATPTAAATAAYNNNKKQIRDDDQTHYFCKLGCAFYLCSSFSSKLNPDGEKVESCVDSCSKTCLHI